MRCMLLFLPLEPCIKPISSLFMIEHPKSYSLCMLGLLEQVLSRSGKPEVLTGSHRPYGSNKASLNEIRRIREAGGWVCFLNLIFMSKYTWLNNSIVRHRSVTFYIFKESPWYILHIKAFLMEHNICRLWEVNFISMLLKLIHIDLHTRITLPSNLSDV